LTDPLTDFLLSKIFFDPNGNDEKAKSRKMVIKMLYQGSESIAIFGHGILAMREMEKDSEEMGVDSEHN
jgi:hypothetical protein